MRTNWEENVRLQALVRDGHAVLVPEVITIEDADVKDLESEWDAGSVSGGSVEVLSSGGARLTSTPTSVVPATTNDGADTTKLTHVAPFEAVLVRWTSHPSDTEIHNLVARLDPRDDGGQPKTVSEFRAQLFRIAEYRSVGPINAISIVPISAEVIVDATGEVAADFTFNFQGAGIYSPYPRIGDSPINGPTHHPRTLVRIIALQDDGTVADNVTWLSESGGNDESGTGWDAELVQLNAIDDVGNEDLGGSLYELDTTTPTVYPDFELNRTDYTAATITFSGTGVEIPDLSGTGDLKIVARGHTPSDSTLTFEIFDGSSWVECFDGDVLGDDNSATGGGDLSGISTTGPWDIRVTLTPSTAADLNSPVVKEFGIERGDSTILTGAATISGDVRQVDPLTLVGNIAKASLLVKKLGEPDARDYGSDVLAENHIGQVYVRVWVADAGAGRDDAYLSRSEWMLLSVWDVDDYRSTDTQHEIDLISPLRRLKVIIPPFVVTSGNDGTRTAVEISGTMKAAYEEIIDTLVGLAARFRGPGIEDATNTVSKLITRSDAKEEADRLAYLDGSAVVESQGRVRTVKMMYDGAGGDVPVAYFPLGSYESVDGYGPGYTARVDEYFVRFNWNEISQFFEDERRYFNATAFSVLGGSGLNTTEQLPAQTSKWISTQAVADAVGDRVPKHFGNGLIVWRILSNGANPHLEVGDAVVVETRGFVGRSPINSQEIRGAVTALAVIARVGDPWGRMLDLWVPSFDKIVTGTGDVTPLAFGGGILHSDLTSRTHTGDTNETTLETYSLAGGHVGANGILTINVSWAPSGGNSTATLRLKVDGTLFGAALSVSADGTERQTTLEIYADGSESSQFVKFRWEYDGTSPGRLQQARSVDLSAGVDITVTGELANSADTFAVTQTLIELRRDS